MIGTHEQFLRDLEASKGPVELIASWFRSLGKEVIVPELSKAPDKEQWKDYIDHGDLYVDGHRVEVKGLSCNWTCAADWPFKDFLVCAKHSYDLADPKPHGYIYLNKAMTHIATVKSETYSKWGYRSVFDWRFDQTQVTYCIDPGWVKFAKLEIK